MTVRDIVRAAVAASGGDAEQALTEVAEWVCDGGEEERSALFRALRPRVGCPPSLAAAVDRALDLAQDDDVFDAIVRERLDRREFPQFRARVDQEIADECIAALRRWVEAEAWAWRRRRAT